MHLISINEAQAALASGWSLRGCVVDRLTGGELNDVFKVGLPDRAYVLRVSRVEKTRDAIVFEHHVMRMMAETGLPVPPPVKGTNGSTVQEWQGRLLTLMPFAKGLAANPSDARHGRLAARLLAEIHVTSRSLLGEHRRPDELGLLDERWWAWRQLRHFFDARRAELDVDDSVWRVLDDEVAELDERLSGLSADHPRATIHGDFNPRNLLVTADLHATVIDWDDCRYDWTEWELAQGAGHFGGTDARRVEEFVRVYVAAGGPVSRQTQQVIPLFMRCGAINEVFWALDENDGKSVLHPKAARMLDGVATTALKLRSFEKEFTER